MFTKAIVLSRTDFGTLVFDLMDSFVDREEEVRSGEITEEDARYYLAASFEEVLDAMGVDEMVAFIGERREAVEIKDGDTFVRYALRHLETENLLDSIREWLGLD